jgi:alpha-tubulin suppressor-like RCC1 family protein
VWCWGDNAYGQIGQGFIGGQLDAPVVAQMPSGLKATQISCGSQHSCALLIDGTVACWGQDNSGQSGGGSSDASGFNYSGSTPVVVKLSGKAIAVGVGGTTLPKTGYSCAVIEGGSVQCWGYNGDGERGRGDAGSQTCVGGLPCIVTPGNVVFP